MKRKTIDIENLSMELDCSEATNPSFKKPSAVPQKQAKHLPNDVLVARSGRKRFGKKSPQFFQCITAIVKQLIDDYEKGATSNVSKIKADYSTKYSLIDSPKTVEIISAIPEEYRDALVPILKTKPVRTASGIVAVAVMCKPHRCPHQAKTGKHCLYCPGGLDSDFEYSTQSYTGYEPTSMRAVRARYDPYIQARNRIDQLKRLGHPTDKVEYIIMGGTFMSLDPKYRADFCRDLHDALSGHRSATVEEAVRYSEQSDTKCVGLTIETRPDHCSAQQIHDMLTYGCTRLEIGVQTIYDDILMLVNRGHDAQEVVDCFHRIRDAGLKVVAHIMPDLPQMGVERDLQCFSELFESTCYRPDGLKIYPTLVMRGTGVYEMWKAGKFRSYSAETLIDVLAKCLSMVPCWTRVYRIQRDIPMPLVTSGVEYSNLRELVLKRMKDLGLTCRDIRTREVGMMEIHSKVVPDQVELIRRDYVANDGWETFLSYEDPRKDILIGMLRLRKPSGQSAFKSCDELSDGYTSIIREVHVYGSVVPIHTRNPRLFQHQGYGTLLVEEAERIAREEHGSKKISVISGVGTRHYYRKLGYELDGPYMSKMLDTTEVEAMNEDDWE